MWHQKHHVQGLGGSEGCAPPQAGKKAGKNSLPERTLHTQNPEEEPGLGWGLIGSDTFQCWNLGMALVDNGGFLVCF